MGPKGGRAITCPLFRRLCNNTSVKLPILNSFFLLFFWRSRPSRHNMLVLKWSKQHFEQVEESIFRQITLVHIRYAVGVFLCSNQLFIAVSKLKVNLSSLICQKKKGITYLDQIRNFWILPEFCDRAKIFFRVSQKYINDGNI